MQLSHAIPKSWKNYFSPVKEKIHHLVVQDHHLIRKQSMYFLNRSSSYEITFLLSLKKMKQLRWRLYYQETFNNNNLDWKNSFVLVRIVKKDSKLPAF